MKKKRSKVVKLRTFFLCGVKDPYVLMVPKDNEWEERRKAIGLSDQDCTDIILRYIKGHPFLFQVDDSFLVKTGMNVTAVTYEVYVENDYRPYHAEVIMGRFLIMGCTKDGDSRDLTPTEVSIIKSAINPHGILTYEMTKGAWPCRSN